MHLLLGINWTFRFFVFVFFFCLKTLIPTKAQLLDGLCLCVFVRCRCHRHRNTTCRVLHTLWIANVAQLVSCMRDGRALAAGPSLVIAHEDRNKSSKYIIHPFEQVIFQFLFWMLERRAVGGGARKKNGFVAVEESTITQTDILFEFYTIHELTTNWSNFRFPSHFHHHHRIAVVVFFVLFWFLRLSAQRLRFELDTNLHLIRIYWFSTGKFSVISRRRNAFPLFSVVYFISVLYVSVSVSVLRVCFCVCVRCPYLCVTYDNGTVSNGHADAKHSRRQQQQQRRERNMNGKTEEKWRKWIANNIFGRYELADVNTGHNIGHRTLKSYFWMGEILSKWLGRLLVPYVAPSQMLRYKNCKTFIFVVFDFVHRVHISREHSLTHTQRTRVHRHWQ